MQPNNGDTQHLVFWSAGWHEQLPKGWYAQQLTYEGDRWEATALVGPLESKDAAEHESDLLVESLAD